MSKAFSIDQADIVAIYDSRGRPTVQVMLGAGQAHGSGIAPAGASRGRFEAHELRDPDGGVRAACVGFIKEIAPRLKGMDVRDQAGIDEMLIALDGTANRARLGGNTLIATSMAAVQLAAAASGTSLWRYLATRQPDTELAMPPPRI